MAIGIGGLFHAAFLGPSDIWADGWAHNQTPLAYGRETLMEHYNGSSWSVVDTASPPIRNSEFVGIAATGDSDIWAIGDHVSGNNDVPLVEHYDGSSWSQYSPPSPTGGFDLRLSSIAEISPTDVWLVGSATVNDPYGTESEPLTEHYDGTSWDAEYGTVGSSGAGEFQSFYATSPNDIWAVGQQKLYGLIDHYNGSAWTVVGPTNFPGPFLSVTAPSDTEVWVVGENTETPGTAEIAHFDGTNWTQPSVSILSPPSSLWQVTSTSGATWFQGSSPYTATGAWFGEFDGTAWSQTSTPAFSSGDGGYLLASPDGKLWFFGETADGYTRIESREASCPS